MPGGEFLLWSSGIDTYFITSIVHICLSTHKIMGNPNPKQKLKPLYGDEALADRPLSVRVAKELDAYVRSQSNPPEWLRKAIAAQAERDMMQQQQGDCA